MNKNNIVLIIVALLTTLVTSLAFRPHPKTFGSQLYTDQERMTCNPVACYTTGTYYQGKGCAFNAAIQVYTSQTSCSYNKPWMISRTVTF
jgi:hypothetical protein